MIDRKARTDLEQALRRYSAGRTTSDELDETALETARSSTDLAVRNIADAQWSLYDDTRGGHATGEDRLTRTQRAAIATWILFLRSDLEYQWSGRLFHPAVSFRTFANLVTLGLFNLVFPAPARVDDEGDLNVWPFRSRMEMRREMRRVEDRIRSATIPQS